MLSIASISGTNLAKTTTFRPSSMHVSMMSSSASSFAVLIHIASSPEHISSRIYPPVHCESLNSCVRTFLAVTSFSSDRTAKQSLSSIWYIDLAFGSNSTSLVSSITDGRSTASSSFTLNAMLCTFSTSSDKWLYPMIWWFWYPPNMAYRFLKR